MSRRGPVVQIDTRTFAVSRPAAANERVARRAPARGPSFPWAPVIGVAAGALAAAGALRRRRRVAIAALRAR